MKDRHPHALESVITAKDRHKQSRTGKLKQKRSLQNKSRQPDYAADLGGGYCLLHGASLHQGYLSARNQRKRSRNRDNSESAYLYENENDGLTEHRPVASRILNDKSRNANCGGGGEQGLIKRSDLARSRGDRQHQKKCSDKDHSRKSEENSLKGG